MESDKRAVLRFIMEGGHVLQVTFTTFRLAHDYLAAWADGSLTGRVRGVDADGVPWALETSRVQAAIVYDPKAVEEQQMELIRKQQSAQLGATKPALPPGFGPGPGRYPPPSRS